MPFLSRVSTGYHGYLNRRILPEPEIPYTGGMLGNLLSLSESLSSLTNISSTNFGNVQQIINSVNNSFNVFAVITDVNNAESLRGIPSSDGKTNFSLPRFVYNTSNSNILSTGNVIMEMSGGDNYSLDIIDGKKWMASAIFSGSTNGFLGILLWVFTDDLINTSDVVSVGGRTISDVRSIFHPVMSANNFARIYQVVIGNSGNILDYDISGNAGWNYSDAQSAGITGYYTTTNFSIDDGLWAFVLGGKVNGNSGPSYSVASGYGFGNFNASDSSSVLYWNGSSYSSTNYVGFIFTGDA